MCEDGFGARKGTSVASTPAPLGAEAGAWKGNSAGSLADMGDAVGADRMILGAPLEGDGMWISSVSLALCPSRSGERIRRPSSLPFTTGRAMGETLESGESAMVAETSGSLVTWVLYCHGGRHGSGMDSSLAVSWQDSFLNTTRNTAGQDHHSTGPCAVRVISRVVSPARRRAKTFGVTSWRFRLPDRPRRRTSTPRCFMRPCPVFETRVTEPACARPCVRAYSASAPRPSSDCALRLGCLPPPRTALQAWVHDGGFPTFTQAAVV